MSGISGSRRGASKNRPGNAIYEEIVPDFEWIEDSANHWLGLEVPGFRREEVKLEVNTYGLIKIAGERKISEIKYVWFEQIFQAPENSKPEDCRVGLEDGLFYVQIPKKATHKQQPEKIHAAPTPAKTPRPEEDSDREKGKKVNTDTGDYPNKNEATTEKIPASTPTKPPRDEEGSDREEAKKVNDTGEGTIEKIPASTPTKEPKDEEDSDREKGKKVNDSGEFPNKNEGTVGKIPDATPVMTPKDEEESNQEKGKKVNDNGDCPNKSKGASEEEQYHDAKGEDKSNEGNFLAKVAKKVIQNKGIFLTAILILSAGFLVSQDKIKRAKSNEELLAKLDAQNHSNDDD